MPTRRVFELILITVVLWDVGRGTLKLWVHKTWGSTTPGSPAHETADVVSAFL